MFELSVHGGLCNRLQTILSYRHVYKKMRVYWRPDSQICNAKFSDVFQKLDGVEFSYHAPDPAHEIMHDNQPCRGAQREWLQGYKDLKIHQEYRNRLNHQIMLPYAAVHIRRTDFTQLATKADCFMEDKYFLDFVKNSGHEKIYLSTDNGTTQRVFSRMINFMGKAVVIQDDIKEHENQNEHDTRNTDLGFAVVDLFACSRASVFLGTSGSSFSQTVECLRSLGGGWWV
jgi:hypothetical protein